MEMLFKKDIQGDASLEAVRIIAQMIKAKSYVVRQQVSIVIIRYEKI